MKCIKSLLAALGLAIVTANASATLIDFEAEGTSPYNALNFAIDGYVFNFTMDIYAGAIYSNAPTFGNYAALNDYGGVGTIERSNGEVFNLQSLYFGNWDSSYGVGQFVVTGYRNGTQVAQVAADTTLNQLTFLATNFTNVDSVSFELFNTSTIFVIDNISVNAVPEPGTYAMLLAGLGVIGAITRRRQRQ